MLKLSDYKDFKNKKVLITGTTGFKGSWLAFWLSYLGAKVYGVALKADHDAILFKNLNIQKKIYQSYFDICDFNKLNELIKKIKPDVIIHLAAQSIVSFSYLEPLKTFKTNIIGSANILESFRRNKLPALVYITSDKCYLNLNQNKSFKEQDKLGGLDNYSSSKASAENIFLSYHSSYFKQLDELRAASARAGNVIGGGDFKQDRIIPDIIRAIIKKKSLMIRSPNATRPWQHVLEPLSGYLLLAHKILNKKLKNDLMPNWNFGPEKKNCKTVLYLTNEFVKKLNKKAKIKVNLKSKFSESKFLSLDISKSKKELKWKPKLSFIETVQYTAEWYKALIYKNDIEKITIEQINLFSEKK